MRSFPSCLRAFVPSCLIFLGCTYNSTTPAPDAQTAQQKQEAALRDPINYQPDDNTNRYDISGGGFNNLDKGAIKKDLHNALDP